MTEIKEELIIKYRKLIRRCINLHLYGSALFWADKVASTTNSIEDYYWLAQCMYLQRQYHRAAFLLQSKCTDTRYIQCYYLTLQCYFEAKEYTEALDVIKSTNDVPEELITFDDVSRDDIMSAFYLLKGKVLENTDNLTLASECYKQALFHDAFCFEALHLLTINQMLSAVEEDELVSSIPLDDQVSAEEVQVIHALYKCRLKKYHTSIGTNEPLKSTIDKKTSQEKSKTTTYHQTIKPLNSTASAPEEMQIDNEQITETTNNSDVRVTFGENSLDFQVANAELLYYNCDYVGALDLAERILKEDPYQEECLPIYIACLVELKRSVKLFTLAHKLVQLYPKLAISWYAVGCYYNLNGKTESARKYLAQASCLNRFNGAAWLAYGHSFAAQKEHDQAMAAYFKASQLMKGFHLPLLYIGLECGLTNNVALAEKFFSQAQSIAPNDPFLMHERGVICFQNQQHQLAEIHFKNALRIIKAAKNQRPIIPSIWTALLNNLGHTCRKLKKYNEALQYHYEALIMEPQSHHIFSAIAYVHALTENYEEAINCFHKALSLKSDDTFSTTMLNYIIEHWSEETPAYAGSPSSIPTFESKRNKSVDSYGNTISSYDKTSSSMDIVSKDSISEME